MMRHTKNIFYSLIVVLLTLPTLSKAELKLGGVRAGYMSSAFYNDGKQGESYDAFYVGLYRDNLVIPLLSIRSGLEYLQMGGNGISGSDYTIHTLSIPVSAKVKIGPVYGLAGISANFNLSSDGTGTTAQGLKTFDYPLHLGVGFSILMVGIEARYNWGMNDAFDSSVLSGLKTNYLQLGATIDF